MIAYSIFIFVFILWMKVRKGNYSTRQKKSMNVCAFAVSIQLLLGIFTVLYQVPVVLGTLHLVGGFFLFSSVITALYLFSEMKKVAD
jgi:cytochrome c oxidase assembly protein subunit 15